MDYPKIYKASLEEAMFRGETELFHTSHKLNIACKQAIETAIRENFDGIHLNKDCFQHVLEKYGAGRLEWVLANTLQQKDYDGRFSSDNKKWAGTIHIPETNANGVDLRRNFMVDSHPAVLDGFISLVRYELTERKIQQRKLSIKEQLSVPMTQNANPIERKQNREVR